MLIWNSVVKDGCLLGWSVLVVWCGSSGLIWWSDGCWVWGWSGVVLGFGGLIWGGSGWLLWSFGLVWWSTLEVCLKKMVWSEYWKLKRWEAELIVVNGSIREKKGFMHKKISMCNQMVTSEIRELFHVRFVQIQIIYWVFRRGKLLGFWQNAREIIP